MSDTNDLNEASLLAFADLLRRDGLRLSQRLSISPRYLVISAEGLAYARELARHDPEFARRVREEFPDLADGLLGPNV